MSPPSKLKHELKAVGVATLFFGSWICALILLKTLALREYQIDFSGWSKAFAGALILGKVALLLEHASFGGWMCRQPAWVDVVFRTGLYSFGVVIVIVLERGLEGRHEHGGFAGAVIAGVREANFPHLLVNAICLSAALLVYNIFSVIRRHLGPGGLFRIFLEPLPEAPSAQPLGAAVPTSMRN